MDVETGSSAIRLRDSRRGHRHAERSRLASGDAPPRLERLCGVRKYDIVTESSVPFTLDASSGSGSVKVIGGSVHGSVSKRKVAGTVAGGGSAGEGGQPKWVHRLPTGRSSEYRVAGAGGLPLAAHLCALHQRDDTHVRGILAVAINSEN